MERRHVHLSNRDEGSGNHYREPGHVDLRQVKQRTGGDGGFSKLLQLYESRQVESAV